MKAHLPKQTQSGPNSVDPPVRRAARAENQVASAGNEVAGQLLKARQAGQHTVAAQGSKGGFGIALRTYMVVEGDSLWSIAAKELGSGPRYTELAEWNDIGPPWVIHAGDKLVIEGVSPGGSPNDGPSPSDASPHTAVPLKLPGDAKEGEAVRAEILYQLPTKKILTFTDRGVSVSALFASSLEVVKRSADESFTDAAKRTQDPNAPDMTINGELFEGGYFGSLLGPSDPKDHTPIGQVVEGGQTIAGTSDPERFYMGWRAGKDGAKDSWSFGQGDPAGSDVAFGGGTPVIVNGMPYGTTNQYREGAPTGLPQQGDPGQANQQYLTQRSNLGFGFLEEAGSTKGFPIMGLDQESGIGYAVVQPEGGPGLKLSEIRDALGFLGVENALAWDGSSSSTLVTDDKEQVTPSGVKNNAIPYGIRMKGK